MITTRASGKLFIAGEYAVVEQGQMSILVGVDRYLTCTLTPGEGNGKITSDQYGRLPLVWRRRADGITLEHDHRPFDYVLSAIQIVERLAVERDCELDFFDLTIQSELDDQDGRKYGLGSSAAVTVATVRAVSQFYDLDLSHDDVFRLSLLATIRLSRLASGGDIAASLFGGWIAYSAPDRERLVEALDETTITDLLEQDWPGLSIRRLPAPAGLSLVVGWTGEPASTSQLVDDLQGRKPQETTHYGDFLEASAAAVTEFIEALEAGDTEAIKAALSHSRTVLAELSEAAELGIETPALTALRRAAEEAGGVAKSSGAGGGDCGIALIDESRDLSAMLEAWSQADVQRLDLAVRPGEGLADDSRE